MTVHANEQSIALYIDPPSHHFLGNKLFDDQQVRFGGDNILAPYLHLRKRLTERGVGVQTADYLPDDTRGAKCVYVSMGRLENYRRLAKRGDVTLSAFFAMECPIVEPSLYRALKDAQGYFKRIFSWSDSASLERFVGARLNCEPFLWPQSYNEVHEPLWNITDRKFLVMINANKLPRIFWQELYTERMRAIEFFSRTGEIDLYGVGWDRPSRQMGKTWMPFTFRKMGFWLIEQWQRVRPNPLLVAARRVYKGRAQSKSETLSQYTFALCFENMILKGWITEKIFDCFFAGTVPIYWGEPTIEQHIPAECFIDRRQFADYNELSRYLKALTEKDICRFKDNAREFLASPQFAPFSKEIFAERFARIIEADTGVQLRSPVSEASLIAQIGNRQ